MKAYFYFKYYGFYKKGFLVNKDSLGHQPAKMVEAVGVIDHEIEKSRKLPLAITLMCNFRSGIRYILSYTVKKEKDLRKVLANESSLRGIAAKWI